MNQFSTGTIAGAMFLIVAIASTAAAQQQAALSGAILDALGARVPSAQVALLAGGARRAETTAGADGTYRFDGLAPGRYRVVVTAQGFETSTSEPVYVGAGASQIVDVTLQVGPLQQAVVVTATASEVLQSQTGAPVTVIDSDTLDALNTPEVLEALRLVPGAQIAQTGARGGTTSMFIRGGAADFNKVIVDGVAANDIGGAFDFAQLSTAGIEQIEVLRQANSVLYGSDSLAGVINITTRRGRSRVPEVIYSVDGGSLGTWSTSAGVGGVAGRFDYYSEYSRFDTDNDVPNNGYRNGTYAGRFGIAVGNSTDVSGTFRRTDTRAGSPDGITLYGIADDAGQDNELAYASVVAQAQHTNRWQSTVRYGWSSQAIEFVNPTPTGEPFDPFGFGANYLGNEVTLRGANGYTVSGRAIQDFGGVYPSIFESRTTRSVVSGQTTLQAWPALGISAGARYEHEQGFDDPDADPTATRDNAGVFVEGRGVLGDRVYVNAGLGLEHNEAFGEAVTPRISLAAYLREPSDTAFGDTKLVLNAGTGIKAPSVFEEQSSLYLLITGTPAGEGIEPIGPERSRSFDVGIEQGLARGHARVRVAYFHNRFTDLIEFLSNAQLPLVGIPPEAANAIEFGAYVNSQSYRAHGIETSVEAALPGSVRLMASYTRLDAEVTEAFSATEAFNPEFPDIPIGAFSPLVGERPFRRPANSGTFAAIYTPGRAQVALSAYFSGVRDDSTFLSDPFFGNTMLLPNRDLEAAYQKVDLSGAFDVHPRLAVYAAIENLLDREYEATFGFPALPFTVRGGIRLTFGGDAGGQAP